ncbi:DNA-directed RNA polymerase specialized sigma24 family protein [Arthrobacter sp. V4I6]|nr:DNA-directed RNA polymerase specialized sigma24 family protein [Arthrobacter sp. V1I7]MDQ0854555.1 DNA-directed RNA polymerase specialized sigma24 family protein [Arthrobacter sp. V4I6]
MSTAFLELWRRRQKVRIVEGSVLPWLLVTTTNVARNSGRAAKRYRGLLSSLPRSEETPDAAAEASYIDEAVDKNVTLALGTLSAADLRLVSLVVFEDYSLADAGAVLNMTAGAAKTRMHRARQRMKAALSRAAGSVPTAVVEGSQS